MIDFRKSPSAIPDLFIDGVRVERVIEYTYLGRILDNKLNFNANTNFISKKCQPRILCLQKLRSLNVNAAALHTFHRRRVESVLTFLCLCWFGGLSVKSKNVLNKVVNVCGKVVGRNQETLSQLCECHVVQKARMIVDHRNHGLSQYYDTLLPGHRIEVLKTKTVKSRESFVRM